MLYIQGILRALESCLPDFEPGRMFIDACRLLTPPTSPRDKKLKGPSGLAMPAPAVDPGHLLTKLNPDLAQKRCKRHEFSLETCLGPTIFHRTKVCCIPHAAYMPSIGPLQEHKYACDRMAVLCCKHNTTCCLKHFARLIWKVVCISAMPQSSSNDHRRCSVMHRSALLCYHAPSLSLLTPRRLQCLHLAPVICSNMLYR